MVVEVSKQGQSESSSPGTWCRCLEALGIDIDLEPPGGEPLLTDDELAALRGEPSPAGPFEAS